ncbi:hypothetical protein KC870_23590, partial [Enterobacter hormaechei]|uniref:hypothetical protein n=1 Tax=Enterobacter hormaechei TaxID=158836 RepID=UPI0033148B26
GLTALSAEFTIGEGELMAHDVPLGCAPDEYDDLISGTCSHLPLCPFATIKRALCYKTVRKLRAGYVIVYILFFNLRHDGIISRPIK